ncbi:hypothetical protein AB0H86_04185 [Streptomyces sp. NPDC050997]|uniref:hypothetical protein n=1 Tax=Streptomyces sp. NPDC050997 TaxID=3155519 RepID=UPI00341FC8CB
MEVVICALTVIGAVRARTDKARLSWLLSGLRGSFQLRRLRSESLGQLPVQRGIPYGVAAGRDQDELRCRGGAVELRAAVGVEGGPGRAVEGQDEEVAERRAAVGLPA